MVDRGARDRAADIVEALYVARITRREFEQAYEGLLCYPGTSDPAVPAAYSYLRPLLKWWPKPPPSGCRMDIGEVLVRWTLFLRSGRAYDGLPTRWPGQRPDAWGKLWALAGAALAGLLCLRGAGGWALALVAVPVFGLYWYALWHVTEYTRVVRTRLRHTYGKPSCFPFPDEATYALEAARQGLRREPGVE